MKLRTIAHLPLLVVALLVRPQAALAEPSAPSAPAAPSPTDAPSATDTDDARQHFADGLKLYKDGDFDAALVQFERAYAIKANYKVLYNIAQTHFQLHEYVEATGTMARYLKDGGDSIDPERQAAVRKELADLEKRVAKVKVSVNVAGATVLVDGKKVGVSPLKEPISVSEGQRTISVEAPNHGAQQRLLRVAGGEQPALTFAFEQTPPVVVEQPNAQPRPSSLGAGFWTTAVGAIALGAGATVTGVFALKAQNDNRDQRKEFGVSQSTLDSSNHHAKNLARTTDILMGAAAVCAGVAVVILIATPHQADSAQMSVRVGPGSAQLVGSF